MVSADGADFGGEGSRIKESRRVLGTADFSQSSDQRQQGFVCCASSQGRGTGNDWLKEREA